MLDAALEATGFLVALLEQRSIDEWIPLARWRASLPPRLGEPDLVLARVRELGVLEESVPQGCARCARPIEQHQEADHAPEPQQAAARLRPHALAHLIAARFSAAAGCSIAQPRQYAQAPSYVAEGVTNEQERFSFVVHAGIDRAGQPPDEAGRPLLVADVRGAPAMANPPAFQASWIDLLDDAAVRDRALAHIAALADDSFLGLEDIVEGLEHPLEVKDALAEYLLACGFTNERTASTSFVDLARLTPVVVRWWRRDDELIVECRCQSRLGWHLHAYLHGRRAHPYTIEPRLQVWVGKADTAARVYRSVRARLARVVESGSLLKDAAGLGTLALTFLVAVYDQTLAGVFPGTVTADDIRGISAGVGLLAAGWVLGPRFWKSYLAVRLMGVRWPRNPPRSGPLP